MSRVNFGIRNSVHGNMVAIFADDTSYSVQICTSKMIFSVCMSFFELLSYDIYFVDTRAGTCRKQPIILQL